LRYGAGLLGVTDHHDMIGEGDKVVRFGRRSAAIAPNS
jgi:hypothetical protein